MLEQIILGIVQGITEWLPVSSGGLLVLIQKNFFDSSQSIETLMRQALFLHLGSFLAVLVYFRKDAVSLLKGLFDYKSARDENKKILDFLIISTLISGCLGFGLLQFLDELEERLAYSGKLITIAIGLLLLITALLQIRRPRGGFKKEKQLKTTDGVLLGLVQGLAVLPGLSRSGLTIAGLLLRQFDDAVALKLSFLMSLPIILAGNIILNLNYFIISKELLVGLACSFVFGILTIGLLLKLAEKVRFGWFVLVFGILVILSVFV